MLQIKICFGYVFFDLYTQIRYTPLLTYAKSAILHIRPILRITAAIWTCGRSARPLACVQLRRSAPLACPSRSAQPRNCLNLYKQLTLKYNTKINSAGVGPILQLQAGKLVKSEVQSCFSYESLFCSFKLYLIAHLNYIFLLI